MVWFALLLALIGLLGLFMELSDWRAAQSIRTHWLQQRAPVRASAHWPQGPRDHKRRAAMKLDGQRSL
jgi:hypothetical protein